MESDTNVDALPELIDGIVQLVESSVEGERAEKLKSFALAMLGRAPSDFYRGRTDADIVQLAVDLFELLESAEPDEIIVRVRQRPNHPHSGMVQIVISDRPFVVDTLRQYLTSRGFEIRNEIHPIVVVERNDAGEIEEIRDWRGEGPRYSVPYCEFEGHLDASMVETLESEIRTCMEDVRLATDDFRSMLRRTEQVCDELREYAGRFPVRSAEVEEIVAFLQWLKQEGFVYLGYRSYNLGDDDGRRYVHVERGSGLGILRREESSSSWEPKPLDELPPDLRARALLGPLLIVSKTNSESRVHRRARMDYIGVKKLDENGEVTGEHRFLGLFTWKAYSEYSGNIPILRRKLQKLLESENLPVGSHDYRAMIQIFNGMPKEELFLVSVDDLREQIRAVMATEDTGDVRLVITPDTLGRGVTVMVILPKRNYSDEVRGRLRAEITEELGGAILSDHLVLGEGETARLHFYISASPERVEEIDVEALRDHVASIVRTWKQRLRGALGDRHDLESVHRLEKRYFDAFTAEYVATTDVDTAVEDIERLEVLESTGRMQVVLEPHRDAGVQATELRLFVERGSMILADAMPMLEHLGLRVIEADALDVEVAGKVPATIHTFVVQGPTGGPLDHRRVGKSLADTLLAVRSGLADDDRYNALVITADLERDEVAVLRAYAEYAFQIGAVSSRRAVTDALVGHPSVARKLFELFKLRFDPGHVGDREAALQQAGADFNESLKAVDSIAHDLTYRRLRNLVEATVRTSYFRGASADERPSAIAFKIDCAAVEHMPYPRPAREIYVHGPRTAGAHLRFGPVARGGIRWSERPDDFRTEVLGLVKTQQVKNAVIVPSGAKGAFIVRRPPGDRDALRGAVLESYREFIRGLLDITDNIVDGRVVHPPDTVIHDGEDPYLVVAADKGTAAFSDTANGIADEYDFWLGDAFASGGSFGYDHKKEGITARGAWECVRLHFREMGKNINEEPVTVVGIGDMSGDVFGNGMLLSRTIKLIAGFDHRHIFIDPDPDPERSYGERKRLFELSSSSWADYDRSLISEGGGVYPRGAKEIQLSPQAREVLGIEESVLNGQALIRAILRAPVELLWNGGIGTYVKASSETNADVGDSSNDAVRIDASELRAKVIGEGGNLGLTQLARIEYALEGGRLNTDAVDNSAGVDMSDHEVNLKILLRALAEGPELSFEDRNQLLEEITDDVSLSVLANNRFQSRALSLEQRRALDRVGEFRDTSYYLERRAGLKRSLEFLPGWGRLQSRQEAGQSLVRPELAVLLAYSKMHLKGEVVASSLPDDPALLDLLKEYFPKRVIDRVRDEDLRAHRLQREIIATVLTNMIVDLMGATFIPRVTRDTGATPDAVARGWYVAAEIAGAHELLAELEQAERRLAAEQEYRWLLGLEEVLDRTVRWAVENLPQEVTVSGVIADFKEPVAELAQALPKLVHGSQQQALNTALEDLRGSGVPARLAPRIASLQFLGDVMEVTRISRRVERPVLEVGQVYFALADEIDFAWLLELLKMAPGEDMWEQRSAQGLMQDLGQARRNLTLAVVTMKNGGSTVEDQLASFRARFATRLTAMREILEELLAAENINLAAMTVASREILRQSQAIREGRT